MTFSRPKKILTGLAGFIGFLVLMLFVGWWQVDGPGGSSKQVQRYALPLPLNKMDFELVSHAGQKTEPEDWLGHPALIFFGFTYCPDICPTTLSRISGWLDELGEEAGRINVAFITVDPERDSTEELADYVSSFHPAIVGYTGLPDQIAEAAKGFQVKYERISLENGYTMDHTAGVFIYNDHGEFTSISDHHESGDYAVPKIRLALRSAKNTDG
ncbi:MAG: SCO family protein [Parvularculales bacterium]